MFSDEHGVGIRFATETNIITDHCEQTESGEKYSKSPARSDRDTRAQESES